MLFQKLEHAPAPVASVPAPALVPFHPEPAAFVDPLDADDLNDAPVRTTVRGLVRVAMVAAETSARFQREGIGYDPMAWMSAPRRLFDGEAAVTACVDRDACVRALLLHGLSMGLDADPDLVDELAAADDGDDEEEAAPVAATAGADRERGGRPAGREAGPRLWTSFLVVERGAETLHAFDAVVADDRDEAAARLRARHGAAVALTDLREGFDGRLPLAEALVSPAACDMIEQIAAAPASALARGFAYAVEQRFSA